MELDAVLAKKIKGISNGIAAFAADLNEVLQDVLSDNKLEFTDLAALNALIGAGADLWEAITAEYESIDDI